MRIAPVLALLLALLCSRILDVALHQYVLEDDGGSMPIAGELLADGCAPVKAGPTDALHASLHCASHTTANLQRIATVPTSTTEAYSHFPFVRTLPGSGRNLSPPVPPPLV